MESSSRRSGGYPFFLGVIAGTVVGAGLAWWLTPDSAAELRDRVTGSARILGRRAASGFDDVSSRVGNAVDELTRTGNRVRDDVAESVVRSAHEVERLATAAKSGAGTGRS